MAKKNAPFSRVRSFPRQAKKEVSRPYLEFGSALVFLRKRTGKKQFEIAEEASLTKGMLSAYETGRQHPTLKSLLRLLEVLGADFRDLQEALDVVAKRPPRASAEIGEQGADRERGIGRAVLDVAASLGEAMRDSSAPKLRIVGSIGGSRRRAG